MTRDYTHNTNQTVIVGSNGITLTYNLNAFGEVEEYKLQNGENNKNYSYTYDSNGNITTIYLNGSLQQTFTYNSSNELVRVDDAVINKTVTYDYDYVGNITSVKTYAYTIETLDTPLSTDNYTYNSQNQRTDLGYDTNGNMTGHNGYTFAWTDRMLTSAISEDTNISYTYNHNGIRTSKTVNSITIYYEVDENNNVIKQYELQNDAETNVIQFVYDSSNSSIYFTFDNETYYYEKNMQGDIVAILDASGNTVVEYTYNIWGELLGITGELADTIGIVNPLRYRGYYYDTETSLYYLQSRYYAPDLMRFISQDDPVLSNAQGEPLGSNLYVYCLNNPVMNSDATGSFGTPLQWAMAVIGGIAGWYFGDYVAKKLGYTHGWKYCAIRTGVTIGGAVIGWFAGKAVVKIASKFLLANPQVMAKLPGPVLWLLGISNPWSNAVFQNATALTNHFNKHAHEWGNKFKTAKQYLNAARNLLKSSGKGIYEFTSKDGWFFKYNSKTNEFICVSNKGTISSFFKPINKIAYWYEQVRKYK